jgi:hypothetical protein
MSKPYIFFMFIFIINIRKSMVGDLKLGNNSVFSASPRALREKNSRNNNVNIRILQDTNF